MLYFCVLILAGNSMSLLKEKLVSKMQGFCHIFMIRLLIVIGVQLSYYWISCSSVLKFSDGATFSASELTCVMMCLATNRSD